jgi:hypothetical protein
MITLTEAPLTVLEAIMHWFPVLEIDAPPDVTVEFEPYDTVERNV